MIRILSVRREPPGNGNCIMRFDAQISDDVRLFNLRLVEMPGGRRLTYSASAHGSRTATFAPALAELITRAASVALLGDQASNDRSQS